MKLFTLKFAIFMVNNKNIEVRQMLENDGIMLENVILLHTQPQKNRKLFYRLYVIPRNIEGQLKQVSVKNVLTKKAEIHDARNDGM